MKSTQKKYDCTDCGQIFLRSELIKTRVETGSSSNGARYYNDRLICKYCLNIRDKNDMRRGLFTIAISLSVIVLVWIGLLSFVNSFTSDPSPSEEKKSEDIHQITYV
jgi:hypothetical protein